MYFCCPFVWCKFQSNYKIICQDNAGVMFVYKQREDQTWDVLLGSFPDQLSLNSRSEIRFKSYFRLPFLQKQFQTNKQTKGKQLSQTDTLKTCLKSVSMRKPGRTRQGVIMLKSPISLKLGTNVRYQELAYVTECQVKILNSLGDPGSPCKNCHFARLCIIN